MNHGEAIALISTALAIIGAIGFEHWMESFGAGVFMFAVLEFVSESIHPGKP